MQAYFDNRGQKIDKAFSFDESAYHNKRDDFDEIIEYIKNSKEPLIVAFDKVDRLSRNVFDKRVAWLYEKAIADEIELHFVSDGQIINSKISAAEKFAFSMKLGLSKYYSDAISDNVKRVFEQKRRDGVWLGVPRIGYINSVDVFGAKTIVPDPERAHLIVKMFEMYATGNHSYETIRQYVTGQGLKTRKGKKIPRSGVENLLKDPFSCGIAKTKHGCYAHKYERIISKELFDKCTEIREARGIHRTKKDGKDFIFKGLFTCEDCGCSITAEEHKQGRFIFYSCTNSKGVCKRIYIPEKTLLKPVYDILERFEKMDAEQQQRIITRLNKSSQKLREFQNQQVERIKLGLEKVKSKKSRLLDLQIEQSITREDYDTKMQELNDEQQRLSDEFQRINKQEIEPEITINIVLSLARRAKEIFVSSETFEKRIFTGYLFQNSAISQKNPKLSLRQPYLSIAKHSLLGECPVWGGLLAELRTLDWAQIYKELYPFPAVAQRFFASRPRVDA